MRVFERSQRLYQLAHSTGFQDLLDILEAEVVKYEFRLLNLQAGTDDTLLRDVMAHAKVARSIFEQLQIRINGAIEQGIEVTTQQGSHADNYNL
jgi:hypothetical protein